MFSSFRGNQIGGLNRFNINFALAGITGQSVQYSYVVGGGLNLTKLVSVMLIYDVTSPIASPPNIIYLTQYPSNFSQSIDVILANSPANAYPEGYDHKCLIALKSFSVNFGGSLLLDLNYPYPNLNISDSGVNYYSPSIMCYL